MINDELTIIMEKYYYILLNIATFSVPFFFSFEKKWIHFARFLKPYFLAIISVGLFFIIWDLSKQSNAGRAGTFWMFLALGAGFIGFILKVLIEMAFKRWFI